VKNGEIVESGNHQYLMNQNGYYKKLYSKQNTVNREEWKMTAGSWR